MSKDVTSAIPMERVFKKWDYPVFALLTVLSLSATLSFIAYWISFKSWLYDPFRFAITMVLFIGIIANYFGRWFLLPYMRRPTFMLARPGWRVAVVTTLVPGAEPPEMLEQTLTAMIGLDYPHDTWVLDEEDNDEVKRICQRLGAHHYSRKQRPHYQTEGGTFQHRSKHGNYNAWLYDIGFDRYDIITAFDPDHVPQANFLSRVLGYFDNTDVGYVQAAQVYYNQKASFIARGAAEETYAYYSSVQMASYGMGYPIIIGCHNTHRVKALKEVGGFASHDADDLLITLLYRSRGWQGVYVPEILARGLTPVDWNGYLTQQRRWARSVLDIKLRIYHKVSDSLSLKPRLMSLLHGLNYLHKSFVIFIGLLLTLFILATGSVPTIVSFVVVPKVAALALVLLLCDFYRQRFYLDWRTEWGLHWRVALLHLAKWPYTLLALCEVMLNRRAPYALTPKVKGASRRHMLLWPHLTVALLVSASWLIGTASGSIAASSLHILAAVIVVISIALPLSELIQLPAPYDRELAPFAHHSEATTKPESSRTAAAGLHLGD